MFKHYLLRSFSHLLPQANQGKHSLSLSLFKTLLFHFIIITFLLFISE